jgi:VIT1/CCC1 family predicted Fe2+/Mn2+ transporter
MRKVLGLTFTAKFIELNEKRAVRDYTALLDTAPPDMRDRIRHIIEHEKQHEKHMIGQIREEKVEFIGSMVLGLNDALIELTGALLGFSFMFNQRWMVAITGLVTALAASLSMASSAYMQARHEPGKDAKKSGLYTGASYWAVAVLMILPYFLTSRIPVAIGGMFLSIFAIVVSISYYTSVIFERPFKQQFMEMLACSLGVGAAASLIGFLLRHFTGIQV